ncbi:hypothetical protein V1520DRAFT_334753 [Lipomyces starkeyi]|uniref:Uncharacterized protein n=1 Tax=Lipomyces starkeyi NRRL Y-11557 TaxID=675824 RepID=A0A1E3Q7G8_LIPST|nr:hypothetical protein LIPSTDRAFT_70429 [Lipomyces starkeyi NRRL Y-11557]
MSDRSSGYPLPRFASIRKHAAAGSVMVATPSQTGTTLQDSESLTVAHFTDTSLLGRYAREYDFAASPRRSILRSNSKNLGQTRKPTHWHMYSKLPVPVTNRNYILRSCARSYAESVQGSRIPILSPKSSKASNTSAVNKLHNGCLNRKRVSFSSHVLVLTFRKVEDDRLGMLDNIPKAWISKGWTHWRKPSASRIGRRSPVAVKRYNYHSDHAYVKCNGIDSGLLWSGDSKGSRRDCTLLPATAEQILLLNEPDDECADQVDAREMSAKTVDRSSATRETAGQVAVMGGSVEQHDRLPLEAADARSGITMCAGYTVDAKREIPCQRADSGSYDLCNNNNPDSVEILKSDSTLSITVLLPWANVEKIEKTYSETFSFMWRFILFNIAVAIL